MNQEGELKESIAGIKIFAFSTARKESPYA
jgi:hypothetical protein